jgi:hypothetical protein
LFDALPNHDTVSDELIAKSPEGATAVVYLPEHATSPEATPVSFVHSKARGSRVPPAAVAAAMALTSDHCTRRCET